MDVARDGEFANALSRWLVAHQPITLAVNAEVGDYSLAQSLFAQTGQVLASPAPLPCASLLRLSPAPLSCASPL